LLPLSLVFIFVPTRVTGCRTSLVIVLDAIIVETKQVAAECIRYLKDQRIGTCIFLPLDNMDANAKGIPDRLRLLAPTYRLCVDLVECEDQYKSAVAYALGSTVVCDTLEDARELCFTKGEKVKVVTLTGHVISKSGSMTGGTTAQQGQDRWEEREVDRKTGQRTHAGAEVRRVQPRKAHLSRWRWKMKRKYM
jgi:structural maintenance of chromosome 1